MILVDSLFKYGGKFALENGTADVAKEAGVYHLRVEFPYWGMLDIQHRDWPKPRRLLVCALLRGERVSEMIEIVAERWTRAVGWEPKFAWVREFPKGAEAHEDEWGIILAHGCILLAAEWMPRNCVAVGGRR